MQLRLSPEHLRELADWSVIGTRYIRALTRVSQFAGERV